MWLQLLNVLGRRVIKWIGIQHKSWTYAISSTQGVCWSPGISINTLTLPTESMAPYQAFTVHLFLFSCSSVFVIANTSQCRFPMYHYAFHSLCYTPFILCPGLPHSLYFVRFLVTSPFPDNDAHMSVATLEKSILWLEIM